MDLSLSASYRSEFGDKLINEFQIARNTRQRTNVLKELCADLFKNSSMDICAKLTDMRIPNELVSLFLYGLHLHQTVKDMISFHMDALSNRGPPEFTKTLCELLCGELRSSDPTFRVVILDHVCVCSNIRNHLLIGNATVLSILIDDMTSVGADLMDPRFRLQTEQFKHEKTGLLNDQMSVIRKLLKTVPQPILLMDYNQKQFRVLESFLRRYLLSTSGYVSLQNGAALTFFDISKQLHPGALFVRVNSLLDEIMVNQPSFGFLLAAIVEGLADEEFLEKVLFIRDNIGKVPKKDSQYVLKTYSLRLCGLMGHTENVSTLANEIFNCWKFFLESQEESRLSAAVDSLRSIIPTWRRLSNQFHLVVLKDVSALQWLCIYKLRFWALLLPVVGAASFYEHETVSPLDLLRIIPDKYFRIELSTLLILLITPENMFDILKTGMEFYPFLMKNILPKVGKRPGFLIGLMEQLFHQRIITGYGPVLFIVRSIAQIVSDKVKREILDKYILPEIDLLATFQDDLVRMESFNLLCEVGDPNSHFPVFRQFLIASMNHQLLKFRQPFLRSMDIFISRKNIARQSFDNTGQCRVMDFLQELLLAINPTSSYARRSMALHILKRVISSSFTIGLTSDPVCSTISRTLMEAIFWESFPDNQSIVLEILQHLMEQKHPVMAGFNCKHLEELADSAARAVSIDEARLSVCLDVLVRKNRMASEAILWHILSEFTADLESAEKFGMLWVARHAPLYGQIYRLRCLLEYETEEIYVDRSFICQVFDSVWKLTRAINLATDNFADGLSMDTYKVDKTNENEQGDSADLETTGQMLFVCCWRCIREIALLLSELCCGVSLRNIIEPQQRKMAVSWLISELLITPNTGTFESIAEQITRIALYLERNEDTEILRESLDDVAVQIGESNCPLKTGNTRRGAGVPRLLCILFSVLRKEDSTRSKLTSLMKRIFESAEQADVESRVRSVFVLEALFRENSLNELTESYVSSAFILAMNGVASELWAVRNSSACLFTGLMQRIFTPTVKQSLEDLQWRETGLSSGKFFKQHIAVFDFIKNCVKDVEFQTEVYNPVNRQSSRLVCILSLLSRLYLGSDAPPFLEDLNEPLQRCLGHPDLRVREITAKAFISMTGWQRLYDSILNRNILPSLNQRQIHGNLLIIEQLHRVWKYLCLSDQQKAEVAGYLVSCLDCAKAFNNKALLFQLLRKFTVDQSVSVGVVFVKDFLKKEYLNQPGYDFFCKEYLDYLATVQPDFFISLAKLILKSPEIPTKYGYAFQELLKVLARVACREEKPLLNATVLDYLAISSRTRLDLNLILLRNRIDTPREELTKIFDNSVRFLQNNGDLPAVVSGIESASRALSLLQGSPDFSEILWTYLMVIQECLLDYPSLEVRSACAKYLPCPFPNICPSVQIVHWIILIGFLRDDEMSIRNICANKILQLGFVAVNPSPEEAIFVTLSHLVKSFSDSKELVMLICAFVAAIMNDDDRVRSTRVDPTGSSSENLVFSDSDRHEYHENIFIMNQLREIVSIHVDSGQLLVQEIDETSVDFARQIAVSINECGNYLIGNSFMENPDLYEKFSARFFMGISAAVMLRDASPAMSDIFASLSSHKIFVLNGDLSLCNSLLDRSRQIFGNSKCSD